MAPDTGASVSLWPELRLREVGAWGYVRLATGAATSILLSIAMATAPARTSNVTAPERAPRAAPQSVRQQATEGLPGWPLGAAASGLGVGFLAVVAKKRRHLD